VQSSGGKFDADGGEGSIRIRTTSGCGWSAAVAVSWITVSKRDGQGDAELRYTVAANPGGERTGIVTVAGRVYTVEQKEAKKGDDKDKDKDKKD
jgi:hypothetical protein